MAVCDAKTSACSCGSDGSDVLALQRFGELLRQQERLIELLKVYTPEEMIAHLKTCAATRKQSFPLVAALAERCTAEELDFALECFRKKRKEEVQPGDLAEIFSTHTAAEIKAAVRAHDRARENRKRYTAENREKLNQYSASYMREYRAKAKQT